MATKTPSPCSGKSLTEQASSMKAPASCHSWFEIDLGAVARNVAAVQRFVGPRVRVTAVVKADGYGHGAVPIATAAQAGGAHMLAVAALAEGIELREAGVEMPILVLGAGLPDHAAEVVRYDLTQTLCTMEMARALSEAAVARRSQVAVHLKVDTGLGRLGLEPDQAAEFARCVASMPGLRIEGVFSHLSAADTDAEYSAQQLAVFQRTLAQMQSAGVSPGIRHIANSGATQRYPEMHLDMVRVGLLTYGLSNMDPPPLPLEPVLTWKARIFSVRRMPAGRRISYRGTYVTSKQSTMAVVPVGYADGYSRALSNRAWVLVRGKRRPVVGVVCMDQIMIDLGDDWVPIGEEAVLIGAQGGERITVNEMACWQDTVLHDVVARLGKRVQRFYFDAGTDERADG